MSHFLNCRLLVTWQNVSWGKVHLELSSRSVVGHKDSAFHNSHILLVFLHFFEITINRPGVWKLVRE